MNRICCAAFVFLFAMSSPATDEETLLSHRFQWKQPVTGEFEAGGLYRLEIPGPVFDGSEKDLQDLRLIDGEGKQWPFFRHTPSFKRRTVRRRIEGYNESWVEEPRRYLRKDFKIVAEETPELHNRIHIETTGSTFMRRVEVYGGRPGQDLG
ncbi:MAG: hypothetical protein AAF492_29070, partial [Verrucomicrobiota bacterium]